MDPTSQFLLALYINLKGLLELGRMGKLKKINKLLLLFHKYLYGIYNLQLYIEYVIHTWIGCWNWAGWANLKAGVGTKGAAVAKGVGATRGTGTGANGTATGAGLAADKTTLFPKWSCLFCLFCLCRLRTTFRSRGWSLAAGAASQMTREATKRTTRVQDWKGNILCRMNW